MRPLSIFFLLIVSLPATAQPPKATPGNRLAYLDELDPYYPHAKFPKLTTPQWVGEEGVEAVVILAIDDMRDPKKYETYLRPILNRLKKIDGRAPVSIMTCSVKPDDPQLAAWLKEGLSIEVHTVDHPCPYFKPGFAKAKETTDRCVDLLHEIPDNKPVCFRMPCCDSLNTPSPRHWGEIFNKLTPLTPNAAPDRHGEHYLSLDSSVFSVFTSADAELPKELVLDDGQERFKKYLPMDRSFVNWIENYPYPYVIGKYCWQFPCMTPSDWQAQHLHKPNNPLTVRDWKAALDCTVVKKGVFNMVFHPHGWIKAEQVIDLIDHAVAKHGNKVKFMTFKDAHDRLQKSLYPGRNCASADSVFLLDLNNDGYLDIVDLRPQRYRSYVWNPVESHWKVVPLPAKMHITLVDAKYQFGVFQKSGNASLVYRVPSPPMGIDRVYQGMFHFDGNGWVEAKGHYQAIMQVKTPYTAMIRRLVDLDGDGICEMIDERGDVFKYEPGKDWQPLPFRLPSADSRFVDLNGDGKLDVVYSNEKDFGVFVFTDMTKGWTRVRAGKAGDADALPMIWRKGTDNGYFVHSGQLWWANEDTVLLKNHVDRREFRELLQQK